MFGQGHFYPNHIKDLISDLQSVDYGDSILMKYHSKTISDPVLSRIYSLFNYPNLQDIPSEIIIKHIINEYMFDFPSIDSDNERFKSSFSHTFTDNHIEFLSSSTELGLNNQKKYILDDTSLNTLWSEDTNATPIKNLKDMQAPKTTLRSKNGLKILSWKVKEIVQRLGNSTYQEVADCLVNESEDFENDKKDEKNIRRRVYDALNVLIAVGVIQKNGKKVQPTQMETKSSSEKVKKLKELSEKYLMIKGLIERNMIKKNTEQKIFLPFNVIVVEKKNDKPVKVLGDFHKNNVKMKINQDFVIQNSDEVLRKGNMEINYSWLPGELGSLFNICLFV